MKEESATVWDSGVAVKEERDCLGFRSGRERGARLFGIQEWP